MLELFAGSIQDAKYLLEEMTYKEAVSIRDTRIKRKTKELKEEEEERKRDMAAQERAMARNKIMGR